MRTHKKELGVISYEFEREISTSLKHELVAAVANGDDDEADKLRLLLQEDINEDGHRAIPA